MICRNCATNNQLNHLPSDTSTPAKRQQYTAPNTCSTARRQPHLAEIRRWRRQSVQMGRKICVCLSSSPTWQQRRMRTCIIRCGEGAYRCCELANPVQVRQIASQTGDLLRQMRFVAGRGAVAELLLAGGAVGSQCCIIGKPPAEAAAQKPKRWIQGAEPGSRCLLTAN